MGIEDDTDDDAPMTREEISEFHKEMEEHWKSLDIRARDRLEISRFNFICGMKARNYSDYTMFKDFVILTSPAGNTLAKLRVRAPLLAKAGLLHATDIFVDVSIGGFKALVLKRRM